MIQTIGIVSLSRGILGEDFLHHELDLGLARLKEFGVRVKFLPHALDGLESLAAHPEHRAQDLLDAFRDPEIDAILCAIGGDDTYRLAPYLFSNDELKNAVTKKPFLGFSDTTLNHFMLPQSRWAFRLSMGRRFCPTCANLHWKCFPIRSGILKSS
ncbi:MAG: LD-carboxypeptidase [Oscillospiraceae bacterium]